MKIRETIRHGDYRSIREVDMSPTWVGFMRMLQESPYPTDPIDATGNPYVALSFAKLITTGKCNRGWVYYEITKGRDEIPTHT